MDCNCSDWGQPIAEEVAGAPCATCGSNRQIYQRHVEITATSRTSVGFRHLRPSFKSGGRKRPLAEGFNGWDLRKSIGDFVRKIRHLDRENDRYIEHVQAEDGTVIHHCEERLSEHLKHGSAKPKSTSG